MHAATLPIAPNPLCPAGPQVRMHEGSLPPLVLAVGQPAIIRAMALDCEDVKVLRPARLCSAAAACELAPLSRPLCLLRLNPARAHCGPCLPKRLEATLHLPPVQVFCKRVEVTRDRIPNWPGGCCRTAGLHAARGALGL